MRLSDLFLLLGAASFASAQGQGGANDDLGAGAGAASTYTTTLPWANGNTLVIAVSSDAEGDLETQTLSTVTGSASAVAAATKATTMAAAAATTTGQRVVGVDSTAAPMRTTTYGYDDGSGNWVTATWTASVTAAPNEATYQAAGGTIQDYNSYQNAINSVVLSSAENALASASGTIEGNIGIGAASRRTESGVAGWTGMLTALMGVGVGMILL